MYASHLTAPNARKNQRIRQINPIAPIMQVFYKARSLAKKTASHSMFKLFTFVGEVSPYVSTPRCARVCHYPLSGGQSPPQRPLNVFSPWLKNSLHSGG